MTDISIEILLGRVIGLVLGFALHEYAHAWSAYRLGDNTAYYQGRLTLDPRAHLEPMGIILALIAGFGWAKPVPVDTRAFYPNEKRGLMLVSLAGPVTNLLIAGFFALFVQVLVAAGQIDGAVRILVSNNELIEIGVGASSAMTFIYKVLGTIIFFNLVLFLFNLIPLAPLDGYKIAIGLLPPEQSSQLIRYERETTFALILLLMLGVMGRFNLLWIILGPPLEFLYELLTGFYPSF
ncbi:MAG: site-2 protease family protein [Anaerolineae bacterium]|nr:site-2 protease family protein [Anaerolineae bacterium]